jgi:hypothetical protein
MGVNSNAKRKSVARNLRAKAYTVVSVRKFSLHSILSFLIVLNFTIYANAQDQAVELSIGANRLDYQIKIGYANQWKSIEMHSSIGVGLGTTFIQARLNPRVGIGVTYLAVDKNRLSIGPAVGYAYSYLQVNKLTYSYHHWHEFLLGYSFEYGDKWSVIHRSMASVMNQRFKSQIDSSSNGFTNFGFYAEVGLKYSW